MTGNGDPFERRIAQQLAEFADTPLLSQYSVDNIVNRATQRRGTPFAAHSLVAAAVLVVAVGGGLAAASKLGLGLPAPREIPSAAVGEGEPSVPAVSTPTQGACNSSDYVRQLRVIVIDYEPSASPRDLASEADLVVVGRITAVASAPPGSIVEPGMLLSLAVDEVLRGDPELLSDGNVSVNVAGDPSAIDATEIADCRVVLFLEDRGGSSAPEISAGASVFTPFPQGFWIESGDTMTGVYVQLGDNPAGWDGITSIGDLRRAVD